MSPSHVTSFMLIPSILAAGFLELFIFCHLHSTPNLGHVFLLPLHGPCYHPEQFCLQNQRLRHVTTLILPSGTHCYFCKTSSLNSLDHPHNFSLISVLIPHFLPCSTYIQCSFTSTTLINFLNSLAPLSFCQTYLASQWIQISTKVAEHGCRKSIRAESCHYVFIVSIFNRTWHTAQKFSWVFTSSLFYSLQWGLHTFSIVLNSLTSSHHSVLKTGGINSYLTEMIETLRGDNLQLPTITLTDPCTYADFLPPCLLSL